MNLSKHTPAQDATATTVAIAGGGAAGFFAAIASAQALAGTDAQVVLLEKSSEFLAKVRISGGGRCNVTHACFDPRELASRYPRGGRALIAPYHRFQPRDTIAWFESRNVPLKTEPDGRIFPVSDSSGTIIDCLLREAEDAGVQLRKRCGIEKAQKTADGRFSLLLTNGEYLLCDKLLLATGGCRTLAAGGLAASLGHTIEPPVPSLFSFHIQAEWLNTLPGLAVEDVEVSVRSEHLRERGPLLITHWGASGPAVLRLSAWGARRLHALNYCFPLRINWLPALQEESLRSELQAQRVRHPARQVINTPLEPLPGRLWEQLVLQSGIARETRWTTLSRNGLNSLLSLLHRTELPVTGKSLNKDEFVTCGGVRLDEVNFKCMESRRTPGLYFAGELLDLDGITGGFNFQAAWTTGWIAGRSMAGLA